MSLRILGRTIPARVALGLAAAGVLIMAGAYVWSLPQIYSRVESIRLTAGQRYGGDKVSALIALARDNQAPYRLRNEACWALGQLGDPRALPVLRKLDTDEIQAKPWKGDRGGGGGGVYRPVHRGEIAATDQRRPFPDPLDVCLAAVAGF